MRHRARLALCSLLLLVLPLAGCASQDDGTDNNDGTSTSGGTSRSGSTSGSRSSGPTGGPTSSLPPGGEGANRAPTGSIRASVQDGPIPVQVTFELIGNDQDSDPITWNLDLDGDGNTDKSGEKLPATEAYNYTEEGTFNVTFALSDGKATNTYSVTINATAASTGGGPQEVFNGSWQLGAYGCALRRTAYDPAGDGQNYQTTMVDASWRGKPYAITISSSTPSYYTAQINDEEGATPLESHTTRTVPPSGPPGTTVTWTGTMPMEANWMFFSSCGSGATAVLTIG